MRAYCKSSCKKVKALGFGFFCSILKAKPKALFTTCTAFPLLFKTANKLKKRVRVIVAVNTGDAQYITETFLLLQAVKILRLGMNVRVIEKDGYIKKFRQVFYNVRATGAATAMQSEARTGGKCF